MESRFIDEKRKRYESTHGKTIGDNCEIAVLKQDSNNQLMIIIFVTSYREHLFDFCQNLRKSLKNVIISEF